MHRKSRLFKRWRVALASGVGFILKKPMEVLGADFTADLLRFALLLSGDRRTAFEQALYAVSEAEAQATHWRTRKHRFIWAARLIGQRLEACERSGSMHAPASAGGQPPAEGTFADRARGPASAAEGELGLVLDPESLQNGELCEQLRELMRGGSMRQRSALALLSLGSLKSAEIALLLKVRPRELKPALEEWRTRLGCVGLSETQLRAKVAAIRFSPWEWQLLEKAHASPVVKRFGADRALGVAAVLLGVFAIFGYVQWERWRESEPVRMQGHLGRLLDLNRSAGIAGLEKFQSRLGDAADWLFLHGMEGVQIPEVFAHVQVASGRVMDWNGGKLAHFPIEKTKGLCIIAEADSVGVEGERSNFGRLQYGEWSGAWALSGAYAFFLAVREGDDSLERLLRASTVTPLPFRFGPPPPADASEGKWPETPASPVSKPPETPVPGRSQKSRQPNLGTLLR